MVNKYPGKCDKCGAMVEAQAHRTDGVLFHRVNARWIVCKEAIKGKVYPTCYGSGQPQAICPCVHCTRKRDRYVATCIHPCRTCGVVFDSENGDHSNCPPCSAAQSDKLAKRENIRQAQNRWAVRQSEKRQRQGLTGIPRA